MTKPVTPTLAICLAGTAVMVGALFAEPDKPEATGYDDTSSSPSAEPAPSTLEPTDEASREERTGRPEDQESEEPSESPTEETTEPESPTAEPEETQGQKPDDYDEDQDDEKGAKPPPPDATMTVDNMTIPSITVSPGDVVKVLNNDDVPHTVTADDGSFYTDVIKPGRSALFTAPTDPGSYGVFCKPHPTMTATVTVQ